MGARRGMHRRSNTMRRSSKMLAAGGADLKICGGIQGIAKTLGSGVGSSGRGIRRHGSRQSDTHVVKPASAKLEIQKPSSTNSTEEDWIYVRGCRIKKAGLRFNSQGDVYVPDSEDEEVAPKLAANGAPGMALAADGAAVLELAAAVAANGVVGVDVAPTVAAVGAAGVDMAPAVAADGVAAVEMNPKIARRLARKVLGEDLHPRVAARLAEVLSKMEPLYHECFIDMYKVVVPLFFTPSP